MTTKWRASVRFRLGDFECEPEDITRVLGLTPSRVLRKGEPIIQATAKVKPRKVVLAKTTTWGLFQDLDKERDIDPQVRNFLDLFPADLAAVLTPVTKTWKQMLTIVYTQEEFAPGLFLTKGTLQRITELGADLDVDLYEGTPEPWILAEQERQHRARQKARTSKVAGRRHRHLEMTTGKYQDGQWRSRKVHDFSVGGLKAMWADLAEAKANGNSIDAHEIADTLIGLIIGHAHRVEFENGELRSAEVVARELVALSGDRRHMGFLSEMCRLVGKKEEARELAGALQRAPEHRPPGGIRDAQAEIRSGTLSLKKGNLEAAVRHFRWALETEPDNAEAKRLLHAALHQKPVKKG